MSDDLISRKAVLEILYDISSRNYGSLFGYGINRACDVIEHAETVFDKEEVIEELKKCADNSYDTYCAIDSEQDFGEAMAYKNAIEIVEKGGIEA